jgi:hypothetical protein
MPTRWVLTLLVLAAAGTAVHANIAVPIYKSDPGYQRARIAARVAPFAVSAAVGFAVAWAVGQRSRGGRVAAVVFGMLVLFWGVMALLGSPGTRFPDEQAEQEHAASVFDSFGRPRGSPRPMTPEESALAGILVFAGVCFGGLALVRILARPSQRKGHLPEPSGHGQALRRFP